jgi:hypothetical protein
MLDELEHPPRLQVTTNGTIWTERVEWLLERFEVDISVSVDAATPETYAQIRHGGDLAQVVANLDRFAAACRRRGTQLHVSYCLLDKNVHELADFLSWADRFDTQASINLVTDPGHALYDHDLEHLLSVREGWARDGARIGDGFGKNRAVWTTQVAQLDAVIAERRAGVAPTPQQAQPADPRIFAAVLDPSVGPAVVDGDEADSELDDEVERLRRWSTDAVVAVLRMGSDGTVVEVVAPHEGLGLHAGIVGVAGADLLGVMEVASRAPAWLMDAAFEPRRIVRTVILATTRPARGSAGVVVRTIALPAPGGSWLLVAADHMYGLRDPGVPVAMGTRRTRPASD